MVQSLEYPDLRWIPPRSFTRGRISGQPTKICVHYTAGSERSTSAEDGALYDQRRTDGTSSHYYIDSNSVVHCVRTTDRSHTALLHGNNDAIHYELCGTAQTREQWIDAASRPTIRNAARQMVRDMRKYGIPLKRLVGRQVRDRSAKGICGHVDFTVGWPEDGGTHTDPGPQFPWDLLFSDIEAALSGVNEEEDVQYGDEFTVTDPKIGVWPVGAEVRLDRALQIIANRAEGGSNQGISANAKLDALLRAAGEEAVRDAAELERDRLASAQRDEILAGVRELLTRKPEEGNIEAFRAWLERLEIVVNPAPTE